jgi:iron complex transport system ATP-binding protein
MIHVDQINGGYEGNPVLQGVSMVIEPGQLTGIIGPNGSGKTTLMKILNGTIKPSKGTIYIQKRDIESYSTKELARLIAVLPQQNENPFDFTVREVVSLGRYPYYKGWLKQPVQHDKEMINLAMKLTDVSRFAEHRIQDLSGGERQRVFLAKALAQDPEILLLDEPTNHLDLSNQLNLLDLLKEWTRRRGLTVIAILHDLNLASMYCDQIYMLDKGRLSARGTPLDVMYQEKLKTVYKANLSVQEHAEIPRPLITLNPREKNLPIAGNLKMVKQTDQLVVSTANEYKTLSSTNGFRWANSFKIHHAVETPYYDEQSCEVRFLSKADLNQAIHTKHLSTFGTISTVVNVEPVPSTDIQLIIFIEANLSESAFLQTMITAVEAINASGKTSRSVCIAALQTGQKIFSCSKESELGQIIFQTITGSLEKEQVHEISRCY